MSESSEPSLQIAREILLVLVREKPRHLSFVRQRLTHPADPEDIHQLALLRAACHLDELREGNRVAAWFWRILRNTVIDENERYVREQRALEALVPQDDEGSSASAQEIALCACSLGVLQSLRPDQRELLQRADIEETPLAQIASEQQITLNNATVRLHRARKAMRDALLEHCGTDSVRACQHCACENEPAS